MLTVPVNPEMPEGLLLEAVSRAETIEVTRETERQEAVMNRGGGAGDTFIRHDYRCWRFLLKEQSCR